jgi:hypothetical protein
MSAPLTAVHGSALQPSTVNEMGVGAFGSPTPGSDIPFSSNVIFKRTSLSTHIVLERDLQKLSSNGRRRKTAQKLFSFYRKETATNFVKKIKIIFNFIQ